MNKRCIVNVATGDFYCRNQERLINSFRNSVHHIYVKGGVSSIPANLYSDIDLICWKDCLPEGSRLHSESPYGFKVHAIKAAYEKGYTSILWIDSPCIAVKEDVSPIFEKIEKEGFYVMSHIDPLENWVGNTALREFGMDREQLRGYNLPSGSCYGFDLRSWPGQLEVFNKFCIAEQEGLFKSEKISENGWHRHDEAILALFMIRYKFPISLYDPLFQSDSPECVIKSGGWL